jgi:hypothetical protein
MSDTFASQRKRETRLERKPKPKPQIGDSRPGPSYTESGKRAEATAQFRIKNERRREARGLTPDRRRAKEAHRLRSKFGGAFGRSKDTNLARMCAYGTLAAPTYEDRHMKATARKKEELATMLDGKVVTEETVAGGGKVKVARRAQRDKVRSKKRAEKQKREKDLERQYGSDDHGVEDLK